MMKNKMLGWLAIGVLAVGAAAGIYLWQQRLEPPAQVLEPVAPTGPVAQAEPAIRYPIPQIEGAPAGEKPLPALDQSDQAFWDELYNLIGLQSLKALFRSEHMVRNMVVSIDNLPRKTVAVRLLPTNPVNDGFLTTGKGESLSISAKNAARYKPYIRVAEVVDAKKLVEIYVRFYPLFQRAYQELGYPKGYFNDRLVATIDHLLEAPEIEGPVRLVQPHVLYKFADPELEGASAGHKAMVRMGGENAARVKAKLRVIRQELTGQVAQR
jgi:hypothetical protein